MVAAPTSTCTQRGRVHGSSIGHEAGGLEGPLANECAHWHRQGLVSVAGAGNPDLTNHPGPVGCRADGFRSLWAPRHSLSVPHLSSPTGPALLALQALPFRGPL